MIEAPATRMRCQACGQEPAARALPFRCPNVPGDETDDDRDHLLLRVLERVPEALAIDDDPCPFVRYRHLSYAYAAWRQAGHDDTRYCERVRTLNAAVAELDGRGFAVTPFMEHHELGRRLGLEAGALWIKDETNNVSGSHKGRHFMGVMIYLEGLEEAGADADLAVASCGNAALAAALVARAAERRLRVFVPPDADLAVIRRLTELNAELVTCPRRPGALGDPCYRRFRHAVEQDKALPFSVQGNENGLAVEGGMTLAYEMIEALARQRCRLDRLFLQVGGGALASACVQAFSDATRLGLIDRLPKIHAVQTQGAAPLSRAYKLLRRRMIEALDEGSSLLDASDAARAAALCAPAADGARSEALAYAAAHRSTFMWPWEEEPRSLAHGILDDETYDWHMICAGMLQSGGYPLVVDEPTIAQANVLGRAAGVDVDPTGSAGLAGLLQLSRQGVIAEDEAVAVIFSGVQRR